MTARSLGLRVSRATATVARAARIATLLLLAHCGAGSESAESGLLEPLQIAGGQFYRGELRAGTTGPNVINLASSSNSIRPGQSGWSLSGDVDGSAWAVAVRFADIGTGYWIVPVAAPDFNIVGDLLWGARVDFSRDLPAGPQELHVAAVAADQTFGPLAVKNLSVLSLLPNADTVLSLEWDTDADLDLHLVGPLELGKSELYPKQPSTAPFDPASSKFPPGTGVLDRDSNARCARDNIRREDVVWNSHDFGATPLGSPLPGNYLVRVDMFDACGQAYANFKVTLFQQGTPVFTKVGRLLSTDADAGGAGSGLFVVQFQF